MCRIKMVQPVPEHIDFSREEENILKIWKELDAFKTSLAQSKTRFASFHICEYNIF
jgi:hypothetical protein